MYLFASSPTSDTIACKPTWSQLVVVSCCECEPSGDATLQINPTNVLGPQSSAFSLTSLPLPGPDVQVTVEQLQAVLPLCYEEKNRIHL